jgi:hypothetical protein
MTSDQREELVRNLEEFQAIRSSLEGRGIATSDKYGSTITLLKRDPDCTALIAIQKKLPAAGIKIIKEYK